MLTCHRCRRNCLQTLIGNSAALISSSRSALITNTGDNPNQRSYVSSYAKARQLKASQKLKGGEGFDVQERKGSTRYSNSSRSHERDEWLKSRGVRPASKTPSTAPTEWAVSKHLQYLKDPVKLADFVKGALKDDDIELALSVVRAACKNTLCTVSWNHLIDWQMYKGRMNAAVKLFNEMKKRAQVPDAYTYTILIRGCAQHPQPQEALAKALTIYQSMNTEKSLIKPNIIHMNAILKMCARAQNLEAMFALLEKMPPKGISAPNNLTYTTVLNALRLAANNEERGEESPGLSPMKRREVKRQAILDGRQIWVDVVKSWRQGNIWIDEELVCAMGRLMLTGEQQDLDDILSLVEQTMGIARQIPRLHRIPRPPITSTRQATGLPIPADQTEISSVIPAGQDEERPLEEHQLPFSSNKPTISNAFAKPGQNSLSLILETLYSMKQNDFFSLKSSDSAAKYWDIFTYHYSVQPDAANYHSYLRILRVDRASSDIVDVLLKMPPKYMGPKTFIIAMSTAERDKLNRNAFSTAGKILDLMQQNLQDPIPAIRVLVSYLEIAMGPLFHSTFKASAALVYGKQILRALDRLNPSFINLKAILNFQDPALSRMNPKEVAQTKEDVLSLTQKMIAAHNILMDRALVPREQYGELTKQRSKLSAFVTRYRHGISRSGPVGDSALENKLSLHMKSKSRQSQPTLS